MLRLDDSTLEAIAEVICGSGDGAGGGYNTHCPYRTKSEIMDFFQRAGVAPAGASSTRKWYTLESLQQINGTDKMERVLLRLASPKEYRGNADVVQTVIDYLNQLIRVEGLEIQLSGISPTVRQRSASATPLKAKEKPTDPPPDFRSLVNNISLAEILVFRWQESQVCFRAGAYLAAVVMMGSILEGLLLNQVEQDRAKACQAKSAPKDQSGKPRQIKEWSLSSLIDVAHEVGWLQGDVKRFSHALRQSRNIVHPYVQLVNAETPDIHTCSICWQVVRAAVADLLGVD